MMIIKNKTKNINKNTHTYSRHNTYIHNPTDVFMRSFLARKT